jgi:hypothetical protein
MNLIGNNDWLDFRGVMRNIHDTFEQKKITWLRKIVTVNVNMEDSNTAMESVTLEVQLNYNYMRSWPITNTTESGEIDRQSVQVLVNKDWLREKGYINSNNYFDYNPDVDRFIIDGMMMKAVGDTAVSQSIDDDILITFLLKREETDTGVKR